MEMTRGLPYNVTTEMDLALWETAKNYPRRCRFRCRSFAGAGADDLVADYHTGSLPAAARSAIERFLERYGLRGVGEIDMGHPRWHEDPTYIFQAAEELPADR